MMKKESKASQPGKKRAPRNAAVDEDGGGGFFRKLSIGILVLVLAAVLWYVILFILGNASWAVVRIPAIPLPDNAAGSDLLYESPVWAVILISFAFGMVLYSFLGMFSKWRLRRRNRGLVRRIDELESEIDRLGRLAMAAQREEKTETESSDDPES